MAVSAARKPYRMRAMERITGCGKNYRPLMGALAAIGGLLLVGSPARADDQRTATARGARNFYCVKLLQDGRADQNSLNAVATRLQRQAADGPLQVLVMIHGFQTPEEAADQDYEQIAGRLARQSSRLGMRTFLVGLHWDSGSAALGKWLPKAVGHRLTSLLGFKKAIKNPYLEKVREARRAGRTGLRSVLFRLQAAAPEAPIHVMAHSLGAEVVVAGLAPEANLSDPNEPIEHRGQPLALGVVTLLGADVDYDAFSRDRANSALQALSQAQVWWITVPEEKSADGMLELRRGAGRGDAVGNRGLKLSRQDLDRLLRRRGLVLDMGDVPVKHGFADYCSTRRAEALARSLCYLADPTAPGGATSTLAALDRLLSAEPGNPRLAGNAGFSARLYAAWRSGRTAPQLPVLAVVDGETGPGTESVRSPVGMVRVAQ